MVHQPLADAGQGGDHGDAQLGEMADRADAGAHQVGGRVDGTRREDHLAGAEFLLLAGDHGGDADAARALEQQGLHLRARSRS